MIREILPPQVAAAEAFDDTGDAPLFPEEEAAMAAAAPKRRREFATARACARAALADLGIAPGPILRGPNGAPQWPTGVIGGITHCAGYRASAAAHAKDVHTLGLDAEPHEPLPEEMHSHVIIPEEEPRLAALRAQQPNVHWDRVLFSAKETVFKAWFPLTGRPLVFEEDSIVIDPGDNTFTASLLVEAAPYEGGMLSGFTGRWIIRDDLILTSIVLLR